MSKIKAKAVIWDMDGVTAAKRAGMHCLAITNTHPRQSLKQAEFIVDTLGTVTTKDLEQLLSITE